MDKEMCIWHASHTPLPFVIWTKNNRQVSGNDRMTEIGLLSQITSYSFLDTGEKFFRHHPQRTDTSRIIYHQATFYKIDIFVTPYTGRWEEQQSEVCRTYGVQNSYKPRSRFPFGLHNSSFWVLWLRQQRYLNFQHNFSFESNHPEDERSSNCNDTCFLMTMSMTTLP